jgi:predicted negative regulator of RcsB-dependent stress response
MSDNEIIENEEQEEYIEQEETESGPSSFSLFVDGIKKWLNSQNKALVYGVTVAIVAVIGFLSYQYFYKMPLEKEALGAIFITQENFDNDSFALVVKDAPKLAKKYSGTKSGELASYMAGASYLNLGDYNKAIEYLKDVDFDDQIMKYQATGLLGDAYIENKNLDEGLKNYVKAAKNAKTDFSKVWWYKKGARIYERKGDWKNALEIYEKLKKDHKDVEGTQDIDKYLTRAKAKLGEY